jgi:hypothetical protein
MYLAQVDISNESVNPVAKFSNFAKVLNFIIPIIMGLAAVLFFVILLWSGLIIITAGGDVEKYKRGQKSFKFAIGGFILVLLSYLIVKLINRFLGTNIPL